MAKTRNVKREHNHIAIFKKKVDIRIKYKIEIQKKKSVKKAIKKNKEFQKLPKNRAKNRISKRCQFSGRSRGYYKFFGLCRHSLRETIFKGIFPGINKFIW